MKKITLHEAMVIILIELPNHSGTTSEISSLIERRNLYTRPCDGNFALPSQISARVSQYGNLFRRLADKKVQLIDVE